VMTLSIPPNLNPNTYPIQVFGSDGFVSKSLGISLLVPPKVTLSNSLNPTLSATDPPSPERPGSNSDFFQFTLPASTVITVDMRSTVMNPFLYLLSDSGAIMYSDDDSGGGIQARIGSVLLTQGTYIVEATSSDPGGTGAYFFGVNVPTLDSVSPTSAQSAATVALTFKAHGFGTGAKANGFPGGEFTLAFVGYGSENETAVIEFTWNWGTSKYDLGNAYGHVALGVEDIYKTCAELKQKGVNVVREPGPMKHGTTSIAFIEDPNGYKIELIQQ